MHQKMVFFIGSSQTKLGIDSYIIENETVKKMNAIAVYNLGIDSDTPLRRLIEMDHIIASHPDLVIIGISYPGLGDDPFRDRHALSLVSGKFSLDDYAKSLFSDDERSKLYQKEDFVSFFSKGRKISDYIIDRTINKQQLDQKISHANNFKNPSTTDPDKSREELLKQLAPRKGSDLEKALFAWTIVNATDNSQRKALEYFIQKLQTNNISVIVVNMPLNPLLYNIEPAATRYNFFNAVNKVVNATGISFYDYEKKFPEEDFMDLTHLNRQGREKFSREMAQVILSRMEE
jgi:lysophospholipase L1-like esterase